MTGQTSQLREHRDLAIGRIPRSHHQSDVALWKFALKAPDIVYRGVGWILDAEQDLVAGIVQRGMRPDGLIESRIAPAHRLQNRHGRREAGGRLALGTWQAIYLWEHRSRPHARRLVITVLGA